MADERPTWKSLASSRLSSFKGYLAQHDIQQSLQISNTSDQAPSQSWKQWGKKIGKYRGNGANVGTDQIALFPGWAARRYRQAAGNAGDAFEVEVFVSGFATSHKGPAYVSRSQRAFMRLAKGFAAIPKLTGDPNDTSSTLKPSLSTEELLATVNLPPRPTEITEDYELQALEEEFRKGTDPSSRPDSPTSPTSSDPVSHDLRGPPGRPSPPPARHSHPSLSSDLRRLHDNLESRLRPFWSTALSARTVRIHLSTPRPHSASHSTDTHAEYPTEYGPVATQDVQTTSNGYFQARFKIAWEDICRHPGALHIAFGEPKEEHELQVVAELLPSPLPRSPGVSPGVSASFPSSERPSIEHHTPTATSTLPISLTYTTVRLISDIDDTVKFSNILSGARAVFRNVFVKDYHDIIIPGMGEWYNDMWKQGVRFHYVSNGPYELLPVVIEFFRISQLPRGSIRLRSYAGRSLFNGLLSAPATRKRAGLLEILDHFSDSKFLLVGDTGEQDLELYSTVAREKPLQVVGVFVRDVNANALFKDGNTGTGVTVAAVDDPTGSKVFESSRKTPIPKSATSPTTSSSRTTILQTHTQSLNIIPPSEFPTEYLPMPSPISAEPEDYDAISNSAQSPRTRMYVPVMSPSLKRQTSLSDPEKKRLELQNRVWAARVQMPRNIPLRVFRSPEECVEAQEILDRLSVQS